MIKRLIRKLETRILNWILPSGGSVVPYRPAKGGIVPGNSADDTIPAVLSRGGRIDKYGNVIQHVYLSFGWMDCENVYHTYDKDGMTYEDYADRCPQCRVNKPRSKP